VRLLNFEKFIRESGKAVQSKTSSDDRVESIEDGRSNGLTVTSLEGVFADAWLSHHARGACVV
jgi:hypothetical protein